MALAGVGYDPRRPPSAALSPENSAHAQAAAQWRGGSEAKKRFVYLKLTSDFGPL